MSKSKLARVELAVHTGHSMNNGIGKPSDFIEYARENHMSAMAVTDVGTVTAFPELFHEEGLVEDVKIIYGIDALVVDDMGEFSSELMEHLPEQDTYIPFDEFKQMPVAHLSILIKDEVGRRNLYELLSLSELHYGNGPRRETKITLSMLLRRREGLLIGSGRQNGMLQKMSMNQSKRITEILDYIEIPVGCEATMVSDLLELAEAEKVLPVAVCAPYYTDPFGKMARDIYVQTVSGGTQAEELENPYFMGTEKVLEHFAYLGEDKAYEIVVSNTNAIADMCELEAPFSGEYKSVSRESDIQELRDLCLKELKKKCENDSLFVEQKFCLGENSYEVSYVNYESEAVSRDIATMSADDLWTVDVNTIDGEELAQNPVARLLWELCAVNATDSAYMFLNIVRLKEMHNVQAYEIGSRGCVGASFIAYLIGITEVNPMEYGLSPYFLFGINGDREPDIDLNLKPEVQRLFMESYETLPGVKEVYRGGTIGVCPEFIAKNVVRRYERENHVCFAEKRRNLLANMMADSVRARGQHPGGIVLIPEGCCVYEDMPLKNVGDADEPLMTSGFEYHSIDHIYTKIDFLGHTGPALLAKLVELTGKEPCRISLDDEEVMNSFMVDEESGMLPDCYGLPEFGTDFMMNLLKLAKPKNFGDLLSVLGLAHGTDVWFGNAEQLIRNGVADVSEVISSRDDIYCTLTEAGVPYRTAFRIAELVRKGRANRRYLSDSKHMKQLEEWNSLKEVLREHDIPVWYIDSCESISYLFPRAHALVYMQTAWRLAWYKLHYPLEYYKAMIDVKYDYANFERIAVDPDEFEAYMKEVARAANSHEYGVANQYYTCRFFAKYFEEGYKLIPEVVSGKGPHPCKIDYEQNAIVVPIVRSLSGETECE